jgi:nucleoside recognition membrane protein YjiH
MVPIHALWLPILLSAVIVFVASSIIHMLLPIHKSDYRKLPDEDKVLDTLRTVGVTPGREYRFPFCSMKDMKVPATQEKFKRGPVGVLTIIPSGAPNMGKNLAQWFLYSVVVSIFAAYLTGRTRTPGTEYLEVFRVAGCTAFLGYSVALAQNAIWRGETWGVTLKHVLDGLIYGLLTGGTFGWLWPK